jgi:hypothetical protein
MMAKWIQGAIQRPGALRQAARRLGLVRGDEPLSARDLARLERHAERTGNTRLKRQLALARTLRRLNE